MIGDSSHHTQTHTYIRHTYLRNIADVLGVALVSKSIRTLSTTSSSWRTLKEQSSLNKDSFIEICDKSDMSEVYMRTHTR
jgi:hypothetical protein